MALTKWEGSRDIERFLDEYFMDDAFKRLIHSRFPLFKSLSRTDLLSPSIDMFEKDNQIVVKAEVPGIEKKDINVSVSDDVLTLKGEVKKKEEVKDKDYHYSERYFGSFARSIKLPKKIQEDKIDAKYVDGILEITLQKAKEEKKKETKVKVK